MPSRTGTSSELSVQFGSALVAYGYSRVAVQVSSAMIGVQLEADGLVFPLVLGFGAFISPLIAQNFAAPLVRL